MTVSTPYRTRIAGTGSYLPEKILTNADLEKMVDTNDQWIVERTGIRERRIAAPGQVTSDLAYNAATKALEAAKMTASDIDMIIVATVSPDQSMPSTACILQAKLGCGTIMAFDLSAACSGFLYSMGIADQFIRTGIYKNILIVGAEILHNVVNYKDRETCILFGDGAGCAILSRAEPGDRNVIQSVHLHADGSLADLLSLPAGGSVMPLSQEVLDSGSHYLRMKGREIYKNAVRTMTFCCQEALEANQMTVADIDWLIPHQANLRILESVAGYFKIPSEKVIVNLRRTGNTSAASVPIALDESIREGKIKRGEMILMTVFGAGLTSGSLMVRY